MSRATKVSLSGLLLIAALISFALWRRTPAHRSIVTADVGRPLSLDVHSPWLCTDGGLWVIVERQLDGDAVLDVISNHGRDRDQVLLHGPVIASAKGEYEAFVDDLQVHYHPTTAKSGQLYISIYCCDGLTRSDAERFKRIRPNR